MSDLFATGSNLDEKLPLPDGDVRLFRQQFDHIAAQRLFNEILKATPWRAMEISIWGKKVLQPRLICWFGDRGASYKYSGMRLEPLPWTSLLTEVRDDIQRVTSARFNSVLLNLYRDQNDSMGWHSDNEPELGDNPTIASLSLGESREFLLKHKTRKDLRTREVTLTPGSLLVMSGVTQRHWVHSIKKDSRPLGPRINLTFRKIYSKFETSEQQDKPASMKNEIDQLCPLCSSPAKYIRVDYANRKYFKCPHCSYFQISVRAEQRLANAPQVWRDDYAAMAKKAGTGFALLIRLPQSTSVDPTVALEGSYVLRSELPS